MAKTQTAQKTQDNKNKPDSGIENPNTPKNPTKKKLSFKEQQELNNLPELIAQLEAQQAELTQKINAADFYKNDQTVIAKTLAELEAANLKLEHVFQRWDELESLQSA
jgi:ATP-binding cassette subfamily F protein uup